jgi:hypothetical protein
MAKKSRKVRYSQVSLKQPNVVLREVDHIVARAAQFDSRVVTLGQLVFFSAASGDAWMLDPEDGLALKLAEAGNRNRAKIVETANRFAIEWTASYRLDGEAFVVMDGSGQRIILGYPVQEVAVASSSASAAEPGPRYLPGNRYLGESLGSVWCC